MDEDGLLSFGPFEVDTVYEGGNFFFLMLRKYWWVFPGFRCIHGFPSCGDLGQIGHCMWCGIALSLFSILHVLYWYR